jgi:hypothetical protein
MTTVVFSGTSDVPIYTAAMIEQYRNGNATLYFFGKMAYVDIFDHAHKTTFCWYLSENLETLNSCDTYNNAN